MFSGKNISRCGRSKTKQGEMKSFPRPLVMVTLGNKDLIDWRVTVYQMGSHYLTFWPQYNLDSFFLQVFRKMFYEKDFFKRPNFGKNYCYQVLKKICKAANISGTDLLTYLTPRSLRASMTFLLIEAGHSNRNIVLRTGHGTVTTLTTTYHNLQGKEGEIQEESIFDGCCN